MDPDPATQLNAGIHSEADPPPRLKISTGRFRHLCAPGVPYRTTKSYRTWCIIPYHQELRYLYLLKCLTPGQLNRAAALSHILNYDLLTVRSLDHLQQECEVQKQTNASGGGAKSRAFSTGCALICSE